MPGNKLPLISVIMAAYNHEQFVQDAIRSIINQTYQNLELIIIDDGSIDSTWKKIQEMKEECEKRFVRIDFSTQENLGTSITGNKLATKVQGKYSYSIASDDVAYPEAIETLYKATIDKNYILVVGNENFIDAEGKPVGVNEQFNPCSLELAKYKTFCDFYNGETKENYYATDNFGSYKSFLKRNYIPNGYLILATALKNFIQTKEAPLEDWFMHLQLSKKGKYKFVDKILFSYRLHGNNTISNKKAMYEMSKKTIEYEEKLSQTSPELQYLFIQNTIDKIYLSLGCIQIYKRKVFDRKIYCLSVLGHEFVLKEKIHIKNNRFII